MSFIPSTTMMNAKNEKLRDLVSGYDRVIDEKNALFLEIKKLYLEIDNAENEKLKGFFSSLNKLYLEIEKLTDQETDLAKEIEKRLWDIEFLDEETKTYIVGNWVFTIGVDRQMSVLKGTQI